MDTVTYPAKKLQEELARWVFLKIDITEWRSLAELFEVTAVPEAVAVWPDGRELGRLTNFIDPESFRERLDQLRQRGSRR